MVICRVISCKKKKLGIEYLSIRDVIFVCLFSALMGVIVFVVGTTTHAKRGNLSWQRQFSPDHLSAPWNLALLPLPLQLLLLYISDM